MTPFPRRPCPTCGRDGGLSGPEVASSLRAESLDFEALKDYWRGFFFSKGKPFFSYYRCLRCATLFCPEFFTADQLEELYRRMPENMAGVPAQALRKTQQGYFELLKRYSPLTGDYLEVGPDTGLFTQFCVQQGSFSHFWLFEPNAAVLPALKEALAGKPSTIHAKMLDLGLLPAGRRIAAAVMIHLLDHVLGPKALLVGLKERLAPDGVALFVTHDESSLLARATGARWPAYCLQHPHLFSPDSITALLKSAGYRVLGIHKSSNHFPAAYLAKHVLWAAGLRIPVPDSGALTFPLKLGNIVTVACPEDIR